MGMVDENYLIDDTKAPVSCRSFVKWVGGKGQLLPELIKRLPSRVAGYYEPFIGGGALFSRCNHGVPVSPISIVN